MNVFRRIEYWIEGDAKQQRKLNDAPWTTDKILNSGSRILDSSEFCSHWNPPLPSKINKS